MFLRMYALCPFYLVWSLLNIIYELWFIFIVPKSTNVFTCFILCFSCCIFKI